MKLQHLIEQFIAFRTTLGHRGATNAGILRAFSRAIGTSAMVSDVSTAQVNAFLQGPGPLTSAWHVRYNALHGFYRYAITRGYVAISPLPTTKPKARLPLSRTSIRVRSCTGCWQPPKQSAIPFGESSR